jgi:hypothetical protein
VLSLLWDLFPDILMSGTFCRLAVFQNKFKIISRQFECGHLVFIVQLYYHFQMKPYPLKSCIVHVPTCISVIYLALIYPLGTMLTRHQEGCDVYSEDLHVTWFQGPDSVSKHLGGEI